MSEPTSNTPDTDATTSKPEIDYGPSNPWWTCMAPMIAFLLVGLFEPAAPVTDPALAATKSGGLAALFGITYEHYPYVYAVRLVVTAILLWRVWPSICGWMGKASWWPPIVGVALTVPWVWLSVLQRDGKWLSGDTGRVGFNPFEVFDGQEPWKIWTYIAIRGLGLVVIVPIVEELFLRGFLLRFVVKEKFWTVPFGVVDTVVLAVCALYAVGSHPAEAAAALAWFGAVTWIAWKTRQPIDTITVHAATNLALGIYVVMTPGMWWLL